MSASPNPHSECTHSDVLLTNSSTLAAQKPNFEGITLIWFDPRIDHTEDMTLTAKELRGINDRVIIYSNQTECIESIKQIENEKVFLITSGKAANSVMAEVQMQKLKQVDSVFIFCIKEDKYKDLLQKYRTIVGVYCESSELTKAIKENVEVLQKQVTAFSFYNQHGEKATRDITKESAEFLWFQLFKDVLLQMPQSPSAKQELINFAREYYRGNQTEYQNISDFEKSYDTDKSIYWYTKDSFLYRLVNKALRTEDIGQLHLFRFFIKDLSLKLCAIHKELDLKDRKIFTLYRGLKMEMNEFEKLKENIGCVISANGFLSTSHSKTIATQFAIKNTKRTDIVSVLYEIECNLGVTKSIVFADIKKYSEYAKEEEVLFDVGSTFKIESIKENEISNVTLVKLIATDAGMELAQKYIELNRKMNEETTPNILFGILLVQMGKYDQSLSYFEGLLSKSSKEIDKARVYSGMSSAYLCKTMLDKAYKVAERAYALMIETKKCRIKDSTRPMTIMGHILLRRDKYEESLDFYIEVLEIRNKFYGRKHLDTAVALNHVGNVYYKMKAYETALEYYGKSYDINVKNLPHVHLDIAANLNNIGLILWKEPDLNVSSDVEAKNFYTEPIYNEYLKYDSDSKANEDWKINLSGKDALECFQESLDIRRQVLPADHNDIIQCLNNIIHMLYENDRIDECLKYFAEKLTLQKIQFDPNDRDALLSQLKRQDARMICGLPEYGIKCYAETFCRSLATDLDKKIIKLDHKYSELGMRITCWYREQYERLNNVRKDMIKKVLKNFIETWNNDGNYTMAYMASKVANEILKEHAVYKGIGVCRLEPGEHYLMECFRDLVKHTYDESDTSNKAIRFYIKVQSILHDWRDNIWHHEHLDTVYEDIRSTCDRRIRLRQEKDISLLQNFIEQIKNDGDYRKAVETVKEILTAFPENLSPTYNHAEYLIDHFLNMIRNVYDSTDQSNEAFHFYERMRLVSEKYISKWTDIRNIQIIYFERLGYAHQLTGDYPLAVEYLQNCVKIQRDKQYSSRGMHVNLYDIGLLYMILGDHSSALISFKEALTLLESSSDEDACRRKRWTLKRIDEVQKRLCSH